MRSSGCPSLMWRIEGQHLCWRQGCLPTGRALQLGPDNQKMVSSCYLPLYCLPAQLQNALTCVK